MPPPVTLSNIIYKDFSMILQKRGNPFKPCKPYLSMFEDMANETGLPTILLASIALQESGCDPNQTGGAGEIGMMQVTSEKCPPNKNCYDAAVSEPATYFCLIFLCERSANLSPDKHWNWCSLPEIRS